MHSIATGGYCGKCGKKLVSRELKTFNTMTGKKNITWECPDEDKKDCVHEHDYQPRKWFEFGKLDMTCTKCGDAYDYRQY
jgi:hypothetical protein